MLSGIRLFDYLHPNCKSRLSGENRREFKIILTICDLYKIHKKQNNNTKYT